MRIIDADALCTDLLERWSVAETRKEELIKAVMADVVTPIIACQPTIEPEQKTCEGCMWEDAYGYGSCPNCSRAYREDLYLPMT